MVPAGGAMSRGGGGARGRARRPAPVIYGDTLGTFVVQRVNAWCAWVVSKCGDLVEWTTVTQENEHDHV